MTVKIFHPVMRFRYNEGRKHHSAWSSKSAGVCHGSLTVTRRFYNYRLDGMETKLLDLYQAAVFLEISPELLVYFTKNTVKTGDTKKLKFSKDGERYLFDEAELKSYDSWLRDPWPTPTNSNRPNLPKAIRDEIKLEASLECAVCYKHAESCEAAHLEPSHKGKCNHPHNLIWLCPTHHAKYDYGKLGKKGTDNQDILSIKQYLRTFRRFVWEGQAEVMQRLALLLKICSQLNTRLAQPVGVSHTAFENLANQAIALVPTLTKKSEKSTISPSLEKLLAEISDVSANQDSTTRSKLVEVSSFEERFLEESGLVRCPLCEHRGSTHSFDCPVCQGDGTIDENISVDLRDFDLVTCKLCKGSRSFNGETCIACDGEGEFERRIEERIDYSQYDFVDCPVCKGTGRLHGERCLACDGEKRMMRGHAQNIDVAVYDYIDCLLCKGSGRHDGDTCQLCYGERVLLRRYADMVDLSLYENVKCPACKGKRKLYGEDCIACNSEGYMTAGLASELDVSLYRMVTCPHCKGQCRINHEECQTCNSEGELLKYYVEKYS